jgi:hypothetical protein
MIVSGGWVRISKEAVLVYLKVLSRCMFEENGENSWKASIMIVSNLSKNRIWYFRIQVVAAHTYPIKRSGMYL